MKKQQDKDKQKYRYIQFPLMLLRNVHTDPEKGINDIISFGLVHFALKQNIEFLDAAKQLTYDYYRHRDTLPEKYQSLEFLEELTEDIMPFLTNDSIKDEGDYFIEEEVIPYLDTELKEFAMQNCQLNNINNFFNVSGPEKFTRLDKYNKIIHEVEEHEKKFGKDPYPAINLEILWDFQKSPDPVLFSAYCAVLSLQGRRNYTRTNKKIVSGRMIGAKTTKVLESFTNRYATGHKEIKEIFKKYSNKYHFEKLIYALLKRGLLKAKIAQKGKRFILLSTRLGYNELANEYKGYQKKCDFEAKEKEAINILQQL